MKVLLVNSNTVKNPYPVPPYGLCMVASALQDRHRVELFDGTFSTENELVATLERFSPDVIGLGIRNIDNMQYSDPVFFLDDVKKHFMDVIRKHSGAPVVLGGSGFSIMPAEIMDFMGAEYGIAGEGEYSFPLLLSFLGEQTAPLGIPGLYTRSLSESCSSAPGQVKLLPSRLGHYLDFAPYRQRGAYPIQTKRGCTHRCIYCVYPLIEGACYRLRPAAEITDEIEEAAARSKPLTFEFVDSTFNDPAGHAEEICRSIISRGLKLRLRTMGINPAHTSARLIQLMMDAGFAQIDCTPDTASPRMLQSLRKNFTIDDLQRSAGLIREHHLPAMWFFVFGGPGETRETVEETFSFIDRFIDPDDLVHLTTGLRIYPGTGLHNVALSEKYLNPGQNLLRPVFYHSPAIEPAALHQLLVSLAADRPNCVMAEDSVPSAQMMAAAIDERKAMNLDEPMFRTLLRIRKRQRGYT